MKKGVVVFSCMLVLQVCGSSNEQSLLDSTREKSHVVIMLVEPLSELDLQHGAIERKKEVLQDSNVVFDKSGSERMGDSTISQVAISPENNKVRE